MKTFLREIKSIVLIVAIVFAFRSSILNYYSIPSGSLLPTLKIGDHVVVNKLSYGFMLPFMENHVVSWAHPSRGDVVVFKGPDSEDGITLIKRVVAVGGDMVSFSNGVLTVNGVKAQETLVTDKKPFENMGGYENQDEYNLFSEAGFSNEPHYIMKKKWGGLTEGETQTWVVPPHQVFVMGDNRDNSKDSRYWGFMDDSRLYGRAFLISFSTYDKPNSWLPHFRGDRWFQKITN